MSAYTDEQLREYVEAFNRCNENVTAAARYLGVSRSTMQNRINRAKALGYDVQTRPVGDHGKISGVKYSDAIPSVGFSDLPPSLAESRPKIHITGPLKALYISDGHIPYHDVRAVELALNHGLKQSVNTIVLNGDMIDNAALSRHQKSPRERAGWKRETEITHEILSTIRRGFPDARILYKEGNHELRLLYYLHSKAEELAEIESLRMERILGLDILNIEWVDTRTMLSIGELNVHHGHESRLSGIYAARQNALKAGENIIGGHVHKTQTHIQKRYSGKTFGSWTTGCLCNLSPDWAIENDWNHGLAIQYVDSDGTFELRNLTIIDGRVH